MTSEDDVLDEDLPEGQQVRLSPVRVLIALVVATALVGVGVLWAGGSLPTSRRPAAPVATTWFAPYVDTTLTPALQFQDPAVSPTRQVVLGFVVADHQQPCTPSWGGYYSLVQAAASMDLDRRVAQLVPQGSRAIVSFGGQANSELALGCTDVGRLTEAYRSVVSRYALSTVDLDLEGAALADRPSILRRASALAALQRSSADAGRPLAVWLTLPVDPDGLQPDALVVVREMQRAGVALAGVNVMTMDFSAAPHGMYAAISDALQATHRQLQEMWRGGPGSSSEEVWGRMGATVMIGQNDVDGQLVTTADAQRVLTSAQSDGLGRVSLWSLNRDDQCGSQFALLGVHSNTCSGTTQGHLAFTRLFGGLSGTATATTATTTGTARSTPGRSTTPTPAPSTGPVDDPAHVPFPVWNPQASYTTGYRVVRQGSVYQAKYYSSGADPAAAVDGSSPWQVVGPVLPGDHPPALPRVAAGTYPDWSASTAYQGGQPVLRDGLPYRSKYFSQGVDPAAVLVDPAGSPWQPMYTIPGEPAPTG